MVCYGIFWSGQFYCPDFDQNGPPYGKVPVWLTSYLITLVLKLSRVVLERRSTGVQGKHAQCLRQLQKFRQRKVNKYIGRRK